MRRTVQAVRVAEALLAAGASTGWTPLVMASAAGVSAQTAYIALTDLLDAGWLEREDQDGIYRDVYWVTEAGGDGLREYARPKEKTS